MDIRLANYKKLSLQLVSGKDMKKGFTLIELILVVAILAVLASVVMLSFPGATAKARDSQRREELQQYRISLEVYANRSGGVFPPRDGSAVKPLTLCVPAFLGNIPCTQDPKDTESGLCSGGFCQYQYQTSSSGANYILWSRLERPQDAAEPCYVVCSNGLSGEDTCPVGGSPACPLP